MTPDRLFRDLLLGSAPLVVWAAHFFGAYVLVAVMCCSTWEPALRGVLFAGSAVALAAIGMLLWRARAPAGTVLHAARIGSGVLAAVGVLWTTLPVFVLPACRCG